MSLQANKERIEAAFCRLRSGKMIIITDEQSREDEGDLVMAAERITPEAMNFMIRHGSGIVCLPMAPALLDRLRIPQMVTDNGARFQTPFTVSIEAATGVTTGVSASDRARTVLAAVADDATADDVRMPGHVFPLRAQPGGVIARPGHTEASVDMMQMAGLKPAAVICEVMQEDGEMCRGAALQRFANQYDLPIISMQEIIRYRYAHEDIMRLESSAAIPLQPHGLFQAQVYRNRFDGSEQVALRHGELRAEQPVLLRLHSECLTGDVFQSQRCDCGAQLDESLRRIAAEDGVLLYLRQEGRGIGLANKIKAYAMQEQGMDTVEANHHLGFAADAREYHMAAQMLLHMGIRQVRLLTNNPAKISALEAYGIEVVARERLEVCANSANVRYLATKRDKLGHLIANIGTE